MKHVIKQYCVGCDMPRAEFERQGACSVCELDYASARVSNMHLRLQTLCDCLLEAKAWGAINGYPAARHYPQYSAIRAIGQQVHGGDDFGGHINMRRMLGLLREEVAEIDSADWYSVGFVERIWSGIGSWQA